MFISLVENAVSALKNTRPSGGFAPPRPPPGALPLDPKPQGSRTLCASIVVAYFAQVLLIQWGTQPSLVPWAPSSKVTPLH